MTEEEAMTDEEAMRSVALEWLLAEARSHGIVTDRAEELFKEAVDAMVFLPQGWWKE